LAVRCVAQKSRTSSNVKVKRQVEKGQGTKNEKRAAGFSRVVLWGRVPFCAALLAGAATPVGKSAHAI